jgi:hypothetical protein
MAVWRKVIVSGSTANLAAAQVDNLTNGYVVIGGGQASNLSARAVSGSGAILADGASNISLNGAFTGSASLTGSFTGSFSGVHSGSFSGSFRGDGSGLTGVTAQASYALTFGEGIGSLGPSVSSSYNGNQAVTIVVSGTVDLTNNVITKWDNTANKFAVSSLTDDGTTITGTTSVRLSGANSSLTGSFTGSFNGAVAGTASWASQALTASSVGALNQNVTITGSLIISSSAAVELFVLGGTQFTGSVSSTGGFTGSLFGTSSWANNAVQVGNSLTLGNGLTGGPYNGSAAVTADVGAGALISVDVNAVYVATSSLSANQIPKYSNNTLSGSNISDTGTQVQIAAGATSGLSVAAGGITVTGNSTFNNGVTIAGNLTVAGTASFTNTDSLFVADKFIALSSGSTSVADSGIIVVTSTVGGNMSGSAFYLESTTDAAPNYGRWAMAANINATASIATADEYVVSAKIAQASNPSAAPTWGGGTQGTGNMWITNAGDIFIYS